MTQFDQTKAPRTAAGGSQPLLLAFDRGGETPIFRQIYGGIRGGILSGRLAAGLRLPATRLLAADLGVARSTIVLAYEQLLAEGYLLGRGSRGTFIAQQVLPRTSRRGTSSAAAAPATRPFRIGEPGLDLFPNRLWARLYAARARTAGVSFLAYGRGTGYLPLRRAIAQYTAASRGVRATTDQVVLVRGAQQAIDLVARVLLRPGDEVWFEDPGYPTARRLLERAGATVVSVPVDENGLNVTAAIARAPRARLAYVAPSHQFPLGSALSLDRRRALLAWAAQASSWIVEDDYDSEFRYPEPPITSLQGLDTADRVIYAGTFSKSVFPALRLGYLIVPPDLVDRVASARLEIDHIGPTLEQATLTDFIERGHFTRHLRRMRAAYHERQDALLRAAERELPELMRVQPADSGMHAMGWLRAGADDRAVARRALDEAGVEVPALSTYCVEAALPPAVLLGFASVSPRAMAPALCRLRGILTSMSP